MILHVDMDAFFASIEQRDHPAWRGRPVLVGGSPEGRGVVAAASYEARPYGVRSAMPMAQALRLCPNAIVVRGRHETYRAESARIFSLLAEYSPVVESLSLDEAYLDLAGCPGPVDAIGWAIKKRIREITGLVASVGIAPVKFVAKLASDERKPDGFLLVPPDSVVDFLEPLAVGRLPGVGPATAGRLANLGVQTVGDLRQVPVSTLVAAFGVWGERLANRAWGIDDRPVNPTRERKSLGKETTFPRNLDDPERLTAELLGLTTQVASRLRALGLQAGGIKLKFRYADFRTLNRSTTFSQPTSGSTELWERVERLWRRLAPWQEGPLRLVGVTAEPLVDGRVVQGELFDGSQRKRSAELDHALDAIRARFGKWALRPAETLDE